MSDLKPAITEPEVVAADVQWIDLPDVSLEDITRAQALEQAFDELGQRIDEPGSASMEQFLWTYNQLVQVSGILPAATVSLEDHDTVGDKFQALQNTLAKQRNNLSLAIGYSLEDYAETFSTKLQEHVDAISESTTAIGNNMKLLDTVSKEPVKASHKKLWEMVHVGDEPVNGLAQQVEKDLRNLNGLLNLVQDSIDKLDFSERVSKAAPAFDMLFNTRVTSESGKVVFNKRPIPEPKKTGADYGRGALKGALWGILVLNPILGAAVGALASDGTDMGQSTDATTIKRDMNAIIKSDALTRRLTSIKSLLERRARGNVEKDRKITSEITALMEVTLNVARYIAHLTHAGSILSSKISSK